MGSTRRKRPHRTTKPARDVTVKVDARLKAAWDELLATMLEAKRRGAAAFDEMYEAAGEIVDHKPPLYVVGAYANAAEFFLATLGEEERTARRWIRVAKWATPKDEEEYGVSKLDAVIAYLEAVAGGPPKRRVEVNLEKMRIPVTRAGEKLRLTIKEATTKEIEKAAQDAAGGPKETGKQSAVRRKIRERFAKSKSLAEIDVRERDGYAGFSRVPVAAIRHFGATLASMDLFAADAKPEPARTKRKRAKTAKKRPNRPA